MNVVSFVVMKRKFQGSVSKNAGFIKPVPRKKFSQDEVKFISEYLEKGKLDGIVSSYYYKKDAGNFMVCLDCSFDLVDDIEYVVPKALTKKQLEPYNRYVKKLESDKLKEFERQKRLIDDKVAYDWVEYIFEGKMNNYDTDRIVDYILGRDKEFKGLVSNGWIVGLEKLDAIIDGDKVDFEKIKNEFNTKN